VSATASSTAAAGAAQSPTPTDAPTGELAALHLEEYTTDSVFCTDPPITIFQFPPGGPIIGVAGSPSLTTTPPSTVLQTIFVESTVLVTSTTNISGTPMTLVGTHTQVGLQTQTIIFPGTTRPYSIVSYIESSLTRVSRHPPHRAVADSCCQHRYHPVSTVHHRHRHCLQSIDTL
jgi:hypothetical protein